jgi:predicted nucleotidyltransferase
MVSGDTGSETSSIAESLTESKESLASLKSESLPGYSLLREEFLSNSDVDWLVENDEGGYCFDSRAYEASSWVFSRTP